MIEVLEAMRKRRMHRYFGPYRWATTRSRPSLGLRPGRRPEATSRLVTSSLSRARPW